MRKVLEIGGLVAGLILIVFGVVAIVMGVNGRSTVSSSLKDQKIVGTSDMTPAGITAAVKEAGLKNVKIPSCSVANKDINSGSRARCFAEYMQVARPRGHRWLSVFADGHLGRQAGYAQGAAHAGWRHRRRRRPPRSIRPRSSPSPTAPATCGSPRRRLTTALNASFMASQLALFGIVVGVALLLSGFGFAILAIGGALRNPENTLNAIFGRRAPKTVGSTPLPTA